MPTISTIAVSELSSLTVVLSGDGILTFSYPGQSSISIAAGSYGQVYTYGVLGSGTNPLTFAVKICGAPSGLKTESYVNNAAFAISLGINGASKYAIIGAGDIRPSSNLTAISYTVDNQSCNSGSASYPNYVTMRTSSAGSIVTCYHP